MKATLDDVTKLMKEADPSIRLIHVEEITNDGLWDIKAYFTLFYTHKDFPTRERWVRVKMGLATALLEDRETLPKYLFRKVQEALLVDDKRIKSE